MSQILPKGIRLSIGEKYGWWDRSYFGGFGLSWTSPPRRGSAQCKFQPDYPHDAAAAQFAIERECGRAAGARYGASQAVIDSLRELDGAVVGFSVLGVGAGTAKLYLGAHRAVDVELN